MNCRNSCSFIGNTPTGLPTMPLQLVPNATSPRNNVPCANGDQVCPVAGADRATAADPALADPYAPHSTSYAARSCRAASPQPSPRASPVHEPRRVGIHRLPRRPVMPSRRSLAVRYTRPLPTMPPNLNVVIHRPTSSAQSEPSGAPLDPSPQLPSAELRSPGCQCPRCSPPDPRCSMSATQRRHRSAVCAPSQADKSPEPQAHSPACIQHSPSRATLKVSSPPPSYRVGRARCPESRRSWAYLLRGAGIKKMMQMGGPQIMTVPPEWTVPYAALIFVMWVDRRVTPGRPCCSNADARIAQSCSQDQGSCGSCL